jgi:histidine triad (HIT) family protein
MADTTLFTRIIEGELPGRFVWEDGTCVAFLTINPLRPGHVLVVPREPVDHWLDASADLRAHLFSVCHTVSSAISAAYRPAKVALAIAGLEVPHLHVHLIPVDSMHDLDWARADPSPSPTSLDDAAARIRSALREMGVAQVSERG